MDSTWTITEASGSWGVGGFAVVHEVSRIRFGFETREAAERWARQKAREAFDDGDESATVDEYLAGRHRTIWRPHDEAARPPIGRKKRRR